MKANFLKLQTIIIISILTISCSKPELKASYDCKCDEIARKFSHYKYEDFVSKWGAYDEIYWNADNPYYVNVEWTNSELFTDSSSIMMEFPACNDDKPCGEPVKFHCEGEPYIGGDGQTHRTSIEVK